MDNLPLSRISKSFCGYKEHEKIWESQLQDKHQEPFAGRRRPELTRTHGNGRAWLGRAVRDATATPGSAATSPIYPCGLELGPSSVNLHSDDTVPAKEQHSDHFVCGSNPLASFYPRYSEQRKVQCWRSLWYGRGPTNAQVQKNLCCVEFFVIPVCR